MTSRPERPLLTLLYVPADQPERVHKALDSDADCVILDLEDAVPPANKSRARALAMDAAGAATRAGRPLQVRINQAGSSWCDADVEALGSTPVEVGVRIPKCALPHIVSQLADSLPDRPLHLLVESALGVERAFDLASAHPLVTSIGLGEADLRADLGVRGDEGLAYSRGRVVSAAAAAGLSPPVMSVFPDTRDADGLRRSCEQGRLLGFLGRTAIHPRQLPVIRQAFTPSGDEVARARGLLTAAKGVGGDGAIALPDGRFVDEAVLRQARRTVALAEALGRRGGGAGQR